MKKTLTLAASGLVFASLIPLLAAWAAVPELLTGAGPIGQATGPSTPAPPVGAGPGPNGIPTAMLARYRAAAATCAGLPWTVLAAIGTVESDNGLSDLPGVHSGANEAGAEGPMQFEPATFAMYDRPVPPGGLAPPSPHDPVDAVFAASRMLCADGGGTPSSLGRAVFAYNHSGAYVAQVLAVARSYGYGGT
jgi:Transglycosylase SLT domain